MSENKRKNKMIEIKMSLLNLNPPLNGNICSNISVFYNILDKWVNDGIKAHGIINLTEIKKDLVYQLDKPNLTVVKLSEENKHEIKEHISPKKNINKIGRNDKCTCNSGLKYKKCCIPKITH